jgi:general L-amino acid transport system substrate-binding protein
MKKSSGPTIRRLLGVAGKIGGWLDLSADWGYQIVKQVGNYGEIFDGNLGSDSPLGLERGLNALWTDGGLMYSMPFR